MVDTEKTPQELWLAGNLRARRDALGMSQSDLAARMSAAGYRWHQATVYKVESATRAVSLPEGFALAEALGTTVMHLVGAPKGTQRRWTFEAASARLVRDFQVARDAAGKLAYSLFLAEMWTENTDPADTLPELVELRVAMQDFTPEIAAAEGRASAADHEEHLVRVEQRETRDELERDRAAGRAQED